MPPRDVLAAGAVVLRPGRRVLLVHRPKYDDWSFPKGKLERGEPAPVAAAREVEEETGLRVRLTRPLGTQSYPITARRGIHRNKRVFYWTGRLLNEAAYDVDGYTQGDEIDEVRWVHADDAARLLTYRYDRVTLAEAMEERRKTRPLVVVRHGEARSRTAWRGDDRLRPLLVAGRKQAADLADVLKAYDVLRVVTSPSLRCVQTVQPYVEATGIEPDLVDALSEEGSDPRALLAVVRDLVEGARVDGGSVVCSHGPVLPLVFDALGVDDPGLSKGEMVVLHIRKGRVRSTERHRLT